MGSLRNASAPSAHRVISSLMWDVWQLQVLCLTPHSAACSQGMGEGNQSSNWYSGKTGQVLKTIR